jgi:hypothetical protein
VRIDPFWEFPDPAGEQAVTIAVLLFSHLEITDHPCEFSLGPYSMGRFGMFIEVLGDGASILGGYLQIDTRCTFPLMCLDNTRDTPLPLNSILRLSTAIIFNALKNFVRDVFAYTLRV